MKRWVDNLEKFNLIEFVLPDGLGPHHGEVGHARELGNVHDCVVLYS